MTARASAMMRARVSVLGKNSDCIATAITCVSPTAAAARSSPSAPNWSRSVCIFNLRRQPGRGQRVSQKRLPCDLVAEHRHAEFFQAGLLDSEQISHSRHVVLKRDDPLD